MMSEVIHPPVLHVVFKTHLDVGFTDLPDKVIARYFNVYIPGAMKTAEELRQRGSPDRYIWTTGSWLIYEYLEQASPTDRKKVENAINAGDLVWHGLPFTACYELMDASLLDYSLSLSSRLDQRFGKRTISAKITDVPGTTRAILSHLAKSGIEFLHFGVNAASPLPAVPPVFRWRDPQANEVTVAYQPSYGDMLEIAGLKDKLSFAFTNDNLGPHTADDVDSLLQSLRSRYPDMQVIASTMDAFASQLDQVRASLPVVTAEIGDTWIHGAGSDPAKVSQYRQLSRLRTLWLKEGRLAPDDTFYDQFSRQLIMVPEHTWGLDEKTHLADYAVFTPTQLEKARSLPNFQLMEKSWQAERVYLAKAVSTLDGSDLASEARQALAGLVPVEPDHAGFKPKPQQQTFLTAQFEVGFDPNLGAISHLVLRKTGRAWAGSSDLLGLFRFQSFSALDYRRFLDQYLSTRPDWAILDYSRPGISVEEAVSAWWLPQLESLATRENAQSLEFLLDLKLPIEANKYGCPKRATVQFTFNDNEPTIDCILQWFDKPACRLPEAMWFSFSPQGCSSPTGWEMDAIDQKISPLDVVSKGWRSLWAVQDGVCYTDALGSFNIQTLDAPLVAPGEPGLMAFTDRIPDLSGGMHFNLYNNQWATNYPAWYDENGRFRFKLSFK